MERKVLYALDFVSSIEDSTLRDIFRLGLGSVMVSFSNYSYEPSLTHGTHRCSGRFLFFAKEESLKPLVAAGAPKSVVCIGVNPTKLYPKVHA